MYSFDDRGGESLTLRPEFTAGIARPSSPTAGSNMRR
jgi:histidyl-tRNA synthetase